MAKDKKDFISSFKPSEKSILQYLRGQKQQFNPVISALLNQYRLSKEPSAVTKSYQDILKGLPSQEKIGGAYESAFSNFAGALQGLDMGRGARGASDIVSGLAGAIGAAPGAAADVAGAVGTVSGMGATGGDVMSKAILGGARVGLSQAAAEQMQSAAERVMQMRMGLAESQRADIEGRRALGLQLAQARSQKAGAALNPLELYSTLLGIRGQENALRGFSGGGGSRNIINEPPPPVSVGLTPKQLKKVQGSAANKYLEGLSAGYFG